MRSKLLTSLIVIVSLLILTPLNSLAQSEGKEFRVYWDNGLEMETVDESVHLEMGGRMMMDWALISQDQDITELVGEAPQQSVEFRRLRLFHSGSFNDRISYKLQFDFAGGSAVAKDIFLAFHDIPLLGKIKVGHFFEPFGLEQTTSSKYITFMERSLTGAFTPGRNPGVSFSNSIFNKRLGWSVGAFKDGNDFGSNINIETNINYTGRIFGLPIDHAKNKLVHIGVEGSQRQFDFDEVAYKRRPESHLSLPYLNYNIVGAVNDALYTNYNLAAVWGPVSIQGEYMTAYGDANIDYTFRSYYGMISCFITGESRPYKRGEGTFGRVIPDKPVKKNEKGWGALELAFRYSHLDLDDGPYNEGELTDLTGGINWYLNPNTRIMVNYVLPEIEGVGDGQIIQTRFQVDF